MNDDDELAALLELLIARGAGESGPLVEDAYRVAARAHAGQQRSDGTPYLSHPVSVARLLIEEWGVTDEDLLCAALLHDVVEDSPVTLDQLGSRFGQRVRELVDHLTKPPVAKAPAAPTSAAGAAEASAAAAAAVVAGQSAGGDEAAQATAKAERDRAYAARLLAGPKEAVLIKAADRIDNLRDLLIARWPEAKKRAYVHEALALLHPVVAAHHADQARQLHDTAQEVLRKLDEGEGDVPDVGPNDEVAPQGGEADPLLRRSAHVSFFRNGPDVFLYHDLVGDIMQLHEMVVGFIDFFAQSRRASEARTAFASQFMEGDLDAFFETLGQHLVLLRDDEDDLALTAGWYPVRGPWIVSYRASGQPLVLCYKDRRTGDVVEEKLTPLLGRLFELCQGNLALPELVKRLQKEFPAEADVEHTVRATVGLWTHSRRQLLKLLPRPKEAFDLVGLPPYVQSTMPYPLMREGESRPTEVSIRDYHKLEITSADEQFEQRETTISHAFRVPHPALENRPYGGQLARVLVERDVLQDDGGRTPMTYVEVGGGTGYFARGFLDGLALRAPRTYNRLRYVIVDLAPALRASQKEKVAAHKERVRIVGGDAQALPLGDASVDVLIANEMIADLPVVPVRQQDLASGQGQGEVAIRRFGLDCAAAPGLFFANLGAWRFVEEVARVLKPGGTAFLSEFATQTGWPEQSTHLDHPEFSIQFEHLKTVAERLGLEAGLEGLASLVRLDGRVKVLQTTQSFFQTLRTFLAGRGVKLEKIAYTEDMLRDLLAGKLDMDRLEGVRFAPCGQRLLGLKPPEFKALLLRKPRTAGRTVTKVSIDL